MKADKFTQDLLHQIGLTDTESLTYLALLEMESVSIRKVADKTGINRGTTHDILKKLLVKGLVSSRTAGMREYYSAESPEKIFDIIRDQRKDLLRAQRLADSVVPSLMTQKARPKGRPLVRYYEDDEGVATVLRDVLQTCRGLEYPEYYVYSSRSLRQYIYRKFPNFTEKRIAEGIYVKVIAVGQGGDTAVDSERKWLPDSDNQPSSSYTIIYGNKLAHISISSDYTPYGVVVEDEGVATMQRMLFVRLWQTL
jgi:HTH-type transcriptional regulator, sugar sensing transcriptional regulator